MNLIKKYFVINNKSIYTIIFLIYFLFTFLRFLYPANVILTSIVVGAGILLLVNLSFHIKRDEQLVYLYVIVLISSVLISAIVTSRYERLGHIILFILSNMGVALLILRSYVHSWACYFIFYLLTLFFFKQIITGVEADDAVSVVSHNGISMIILIACITLYLIQNLNNKKISLLPSILTLIICIWGTGRSGILASLVLLLGLLIVKFNVRKRVIFFIGLPFAIVYIFFETLILYAVQVPFLTQAATNYLVRANGEPEARIDIWNNYFHNINFSKLFFGVNPKIDPWPEGQTLAYNYHNTFINLHSQTGIVGILTILILIISFTKLLKFNNIVAILLLTLIIRWFTDTGLYFESWDFLPFYFTFIYLSKRYFVSDNQIN